MANSLKILDLLYYKASLDPQYLAWYFKTYAATEKWELKELLFFLEIDEQSFYQLSLCKIPKVTGLNFSQKLKEIAEVAEVKLLPLLQIIRFVNTLSEFQNNGELTGSMLLAAREKDQYDGLSIE